MYSLKVRLTYASKVIIDFSLLSDMLVILKVQQVSMREIYPSHVKETSFTCSLVIN